MSAKSENPLYPLVWRWHFVIGLVAAPLLLVLSITGALYAFEPQLQPIVESEWQTIPACETCRAEPVSAQLAVVQDAFPNAQLQHYGQYRDASRSTVAYIKEPGDNQDRIVWLNPYTLEILGSRMENEGFFPTVFELHTTLLSGEIGRWLLELTASWVLVSLLLGLLLWWPRRTKRAGGWQPRLASKGRRLWRDLHAVGGFYLLPLALVVVYTGLLFSPVAGKALMAEMALAGQIPEAFLNPPKVPPQPETIGVDRLVADFLSDAPAADWFINFPHAENSPLVINIREALPWNTRMIYYNPYTGERLASLLWEEFKPGAKALLLFFPLHTGLILAWPGQLLALLTALGLAALALSGVWMWWLRKEPGSLSLPRLRQAPQPGPLFYTAGIVLAVLAPLFAASALLIVVVSFLETVLLRRRNGEETAVEV
ncbi:PepSY-associated TM helix domain-containing protein [Litorivivens sp.]|uniref:PepSY-associated TM helix domain-containing protein n=1 Tax=Litorivivens sp. TaxID=2020868 RepID=UPI00356291E4